MGVVKENKNGRGRREYEVWSKPDGERLKVNCDGSFDVGSCETGETVVVRDCNGKVVERFSIKFVCESPIVAEAIKLRDGLKLVEEKRW